MASDAVLTVDVALAREVLARVGWLRVRVRGGSMGPWIRSGDEVVVVPVRAIDVIEGEIIVFEARGALVAHRAVERTTGGWIARGDGNRACDPPVPDGAIVGRVAGIHLRWIHLKRAPRALGVVIGKAVGAAAPLPVLARALVPRAWRR